MVSYTPKLVVARYELTLQPVVTQLLQTQKIDGARNRGMDQYIGNVSMKVS
jgi:hypothetical protein